jgi:integrase/recombinase XerD
MDTSTTSPPTIRARAGGRLRPGTSLIAASEAFRDSLRAARRPKNTIDSYLFDLIVLAHQIPTKVINQITVDDITRFLGESNTVATRKRRLTSLRRFFRYLIDEAHVLSIDPTEDFFPNRVELRIPQPLTVAEQRAIIAAAEADEPWALPALLLMLDAGLTRGELLRLERGNIDRSDPDAVVIRIVTDDPRKVNQNRNLVASEALVAAYDQFLEVRDPQGALFPYGFQAINGMVDRLRRRAEIARPVTPRTLRDTYAVRRAIAGASEEELIRELGLADDARNRESVRRYRSFADASQEPSAPQT